MSAQTHNKKARSGRRPITTVSYHGVARRHCTNVLSRLRATHPGLTESSLSELYRTHTVDIDLHGGQSSASQHHIFGRPGHE